ncbi:ATPase, T2SS/T4P/T4SS family [Cupriavidus basilensis]
MLNPIRRVIDRLSGRADESAALSGGRSLIEGSQANPEGGIGGAEPAGNSGKYDVERVSGVTRFRGLMDLISPAVSEANRKECIVLDVGYSTVHIVCVPEFLAKPTYDAFRQAARRDSISVEKTVTAPASVIAELFAVAESRRGPGLAVESQSTRHTQLYDDLIRGAFELGASDLHIVLDTGGRSRVRVRRHARMRDWKQFDTPVLLSALSAGFQNKTRSGTNSSGSFSMERAMNTMTTHLIGDNQVNGRLSSYPLINSSCAIVIRLLQAGAKVELFPTLAQLGYSPQQIAEIEHALAINKGLILLNGSTGSGKSTSLRTFLYAIPRRKELCIRSVEEPVEYDLPGIDQMSVQTSPDDEPEVVAGKFNAALKQLVRMDPDVGMVGEIRDSLAANLVSELVRTGHRGLATLHADSAEDGISRAAGGQIAIPREVLGANAFLLMSGYQRLLPVLCPHCKLPAEGVLNDAQKTALTQKFGIDLAGVYCANDEGCEHCWNEELDYGGTVGQTLAVELLSPTKEMRLAIRAGEFDALQGMRRRMRRAAFSDPDTLGKTAFEHALYKASIGVIDPRDIEAEFEPLETYEVLELQPC